MPFVQQHSETHQSPFCSDPHRGRMIVARGFLSVAYNSLIVTWPPFSAVDGGWLVLVLETAMHEICNVYLQWSLSQMG
jgi:hypothetical protein